jgi:hypothetical protein
LAQPQLDIGLDFGEHHPRNVYSKMAKFCEFVGQKICPKIVNFLNFLQNYFIFGSRIRENIFGSSFHSGILAVSKYG